MLEKARREMLQNQPEVKYLHEIELNIRKMTIEYSTMNMNNDNIQDVMTVYRIILTPTESLTNHLYNLISVIESKLENQIYWLRFIERL